MDTAQLDRISTLFKALADPARLRILGLLAERPRAGHELADRLGITPPTISHHMRRLAAVGLIDVKPDAQSRIYSLRIDPLTELARPDRTSSTPVDPMPHDDAVLRAFFEGSRLRTIPASRKKRVIVLRRLLALFEPNTDFPEAEVNARLLEAHEDFATLRRELVDYGFMTRDRGIYRVAKELPQRGFTVSQEVGGEADWFADLVAGAMARAVDDGESTAQRPAAPPEQTL